MGRAETGATRDLERNPIEACNEVQRRFYPEMFNRFVRIEDHDTRVISHTRKTMLGQVYYKVIAGITSMQDMVYDLIRRKSFDEAKFMGKWIIIIDGTQLYSGDRKINDKCLGRHYNKGTEQEGYAGR